MATYTPQDGDGVIISNTKDTKVTLDSEVVHAVVDSGTVTTVSTVTAVTGITNAVTVNSHAVTNAGTFAVQAAAQPGVDIGDVTINNSTGASAVNIQDGGNTITVDGAVTVSGAVTNTVLSVVGTGTEATAQRVTIASDSTGVLSVDDNGASLTVDNATISVVGSGTEATAQRVTIATDSTGVISVDDNGGNISIDDGGNVITVDGAIQISDGVSAAIKATVLDLASGNPISVVIAHPSTGAAFGGVAILGADATTVAAVIDGGSGGQMFTVASGNAAHGEVDTSGSPVINAPVKIGGKAASSVPTAVDAADRVNAYFDLNGRLIVHDDQAIPAGTNTIGNVGTVAIATGGATSVHLVSAGSGDATNVKASAGKLLGWYISNTNAAARYIKFHNTASAPTPGSGVVMAFMIPAGGAANMGFGEGIDFATGIAFSLVTGAADADTTGVAASEMIVNLWFK